MRELLIEKWTEPTEIQRYIGNSIYFWRNDLGEAHRDGDQPAIIWSDGSRWWYKKGELHREGNKPAIIRNDGEFSKLEFWENGNFIKQII